MSQLNRPHLGWQVHTSPVVSSVCDTDTLSSILDMFVLAQCDDLIVTQYSTFSSVASSLGLHRPVVVGAALNEDTGSGRRVWRARNYDYWFHRYSAKDRAWNRISPTRSFLQISRFFAVGQRDDDALLQCAGDTNHLLDVEDVFDEISV